MRDILVVVGNFGAQCYEGCCVQCREDVQRKLGDALNRIKPWLASLRQRPRIVWALCWFLVSGAFAAGAGFYSNDVKQMCKKLITQNECYIAAGNGTFIPGVCNMECNPSKTCDDLLIFVNAWNAVEQQWRAQPRAQQASNFTDCQLYGNATEDDRENCALCGQLNSFSYYWKNGAPLFTLSVIWVGLNFADVCFRLLATLCLMFRTPGMFRVNVEEHRHTLLVRVLGADQPFYVLYDFSVGLLFFITMFQSLADGLHYMPLFLLMFRAPHFTSTVPILLVPFQSVYNSAILIFGHFLPLLVWGILAAGFGTICWGGERLDMSSELYWCFNTFSYSLKTVVQLMIFDSVTHTVDLFIKREGFLFLQDEAGHEESTTCSPWVGVLWCYLVLLIFGLLFMNLLTGAFVEAVTANKFARLDRMAFEEAAGPERRSCRRSHRETSCVNTSLDTISERSGLVASREPTYGSMGLKDGNGAMQEQVQERLTRLESSVASLTASQQRVEELVVKMAASVAQSVSR